MSFWCSKYEVIEHNGVAKSAYEWADYKGVPWETVKKRVQRGHGWRVALELNDNDTTNKQPSNCINKKRKVNRKWCYYPE